MVLTAFSAGAAAAGEVSPRQLDGPAIRLAFSGHTVADGSHFRWSYKADSSIEGVSLGKRLHGRWHIAGDQLCDTAGRAETCSTVRISGSTVSLIRVGTDVSLDGTLR